MPQSFERIENNPNTIEAHELLGEVIAKYHAERWEAELTVAALFVDEVDKEGESKPTLVVGGYQAPASIKVMGLKYRALGVADVLVVLDASSWEAMSSPSRAALLDQQLERVTVDADKRDDLGRPVCKLRKPDIRLEGFKSVAKRHGQDSIVAIQAAAHRDAAGQYCWDFGATAPSSPPPPTLEGTATRVHPPSKPKAAASKPKAAPSKRGKLELAAAPAVAT
jgi:hypothetical protein